MNTTFEKTEGKDEYLTPKWIFNSLGKFDLDPCAPKVRPWEIANEVYTVDDDGLSKDWGNKFVFMNPPYGREVDLWLEKMANHGNGIALIFARTDTKAWHNYIFGKSDLILFIKGRLSFCDTAGNPYGTAGSPSVLVAYGQRAKNLLLQSEIKGSFVENIKPTISDIIYGDKK